MSVPREQQNQNKAMIIVDSLALPEKKVKTTTYLIESHQFVTFVHSMPCLLISV